MTICKFCGYDSKKELGVCAEDSKKGELVKIDLNNNGLKGLFCPKNHFNYNFKKMI